MATTINPEVDDLRPVNEFVAARFGKRISPATLWRWRLRGTNGAKLICVRFGGCWCTTAAAFADFVRAQTENCSPATISDAVPAERSAVTAKKLAAAGLL